MSSQHNDNYFKVNNNESKSNIKNFIECINNKNYSKLFDLFGDKTHFLIGHEETTFLEKEEIHEEIGRIFNEIEYEEQDNVIHISFPSSIFEIDPFIDFLMFLGATHVESAIVNTQAGDYFCDNTDYYDDYYEHEWNWLPEPYEIEIGGKHIAFIGTPSKNTKEKIEESIEDYETEIQYEVDDETELVVRCDDCKETDLNLANDKGIRIITEEHFSDLI